MCFLFPKQLPYLGRGGGLGELPRGARNRIVTSSVIIFVQHVCLYICVCVHVCLSTKSTERAKGLEDVAAWLTCCLLVCQSQIRQI